VGPGVRRGDHGFGFVVDFVCTRRSSRFPPCSGQIALFIDLVADRPIFPGQQ